MKTYKVVYESGFGEDSFDTCELISKDKRRINDLAKEMHGTVFEVVNGRDVQLGRYGYSRDSIYGLEDLKTVWYAAC